MIDHRRNGPRRNVRPVAECYIHTSMFVALFTIADLVAVDSSAAVDLPVDLVAVVADFSVDLADVATNSSVDSRRGSITLILWSEKCECAHYVPLKMPCKCRNLIGGVGFDRSID